MRRFPAVIYTKWEGDDNDPDTWLTCNEKFDGMASDDSDAVVVAEYRFVQELTLTRKTTVSVRTKKKRRAK